jgi:hypothetical protein
LAFAEERTSFDLDKAWRYSSDHILLLVAELPVTAAEKKGQGDENRASADENPLCLAAQTSKRNCIFGELFWIYLAAISLNQNFFFTKIGSICLTADNSLYSSINTNQ